MEKSEKIYYSIIATCFLFICYLATIYPRSKNPQNNFEYSRNYHQNRPKTSEFQQSSYYYNPNLYHLSHFESSEFSIPVHDESRLEKQRTFIHKMALEAFQVYEKYAWGYQQVNPSTKRPVGVPNGETILASMSTLWIMGLVAEFSRARAWIESELQFSLLNSKVNVNSVVSDYVGSLLSSYALTSDLMFLEKALEIAQLLEPAYRNPSGLSYKTFHPKSRSIPKESKTVYYEDITKPLMEYIYLANLTCDQSIHDHIQNITKYIRIGERLQYGLKFISIDVEKEKFNKKFDFDSIGFYGMNLYTILAKRYRQSGGQHAGALEIVHKALNLAIDEYKLIDYDSKTDRFVTTTYQENDHEHFESMGEAECQLGSLFGLYAGAMKEFVNGDKKQNEKILKKVNEKLKMAEQLIETCYHVTVETETELTPLHFSNEKDKLVDYSKEYRFSPHLAESYFILYRLTHNPKYRAYAWQMAQTIFQHCRVPSGGYSWIGNVNQIPTQKQNTQLPILLSSTLKYLYLIFTDDSVMPLDQWVFNSVGHPLPVCGWNRAFPGELCA